MEEIDLRTLFKMVWDKRISIIIIILVSIMVGLVYTTFLKIPMYKASSTVILAQSGENQSNTQSVTQADLTLNDKLLGTYSEVVKSTSVVREVIDNLKLTNITENELKKKITVSAVEDSQVIEVTIENEDPTLASKIANETTSVFSKKVTEIYKMDNVYVLDKAEVPTSPINISPVKDIIIFAAIGIVLAMGYVMLLNMLDNTIKDSKDIELAVELPILAELPLCDFLGKKGRKK